MLSLQHRFLFVHIPKTGGNSIQKALEPYSEDQFTANQPFQDGKERFGIQNPHFAYHKHSTLQEYKQLIPEDRYTPLTKFTAVRNPWDRMISLYFSPHAGRAEFDSKTFERIVKEAQSISDYTASPSWFGKITRKNPLQTSEIQHFLRFERLQEDFESLCKVLEIPSIQLQKLNASQKSDYRMYYDSDLKQLVHEKFKNEIDFFGYQF